MTSLIIASVLLGTVFGRFFTVWIVIPACALTFAIAAARSVYYQLGLQNVVFEFTVIAACLEIGYAHGCLSGVIPGRSRRLEIPRKVSHPAAPRRRQLF
jgi:phosphatidylglycerophosphate synthase